MTLPFPAWDSPDAVTRIIIEYAADRVDITKRTSLRLSSGKVVKAELIRHREWFLLDECIGYFCLRPFHIDIKGVSSEL